MDHTASVRKMYDSINARDFDAFGDLMASDFVEHEVTPGLEPTKAGVRAFFEMQIAGFPDMRMEAEDVFGSGDKVVARVRYTGTHKGEIMGMPATGKHVDVQLIDMFLFDSDGRVCEHWGVMDMMGMMQQLGVIPENPLG